MSEAAPSTIASPRKSAGRQAIGAGLAVIVLGASASAAIGLGERLGPATPVRSIDLLVPFYVLMGATYALAAALWHRFSSRSGPYRSFGQSVVDTGLMSLGKYVPGKIWGMVLRGRRTRSLSSLDRRQVGLSIIEQGFSLGAGTALAIGLVSHGWISEELDHVAAATAVTVAVTIGLAYAAVLALDILSRRFRQLPETRDSHGDSRLCTAIGYSSLWLLSATPFLVLVGHGNSPPFAETVQVTASFVSAVVVGWIAIFAPAGIGVREAVFAWSAPASMSWTEAAYWIAIHRALMTASDLVFGSVCFVTSWRGGPLGRIQRA